MGDMIKEINGIAAATEKESGAILPRVSANGLDPNGASGSRKYFTPQNFAEYLSKNSSLWNAFAQVYNRIAFTVITSRVWENPLAFLFKKQDFGYAIQEVFINLAKPLKYDPWGKGERQWKRVMPDVRNMMHVLNIATFVKQTVYDQGLRTAFTNETEWTIFRDKLVDAITDGLSLALYSAAKYTLALYNMETGVVSVPIPDYVATPSAATKALLEISEDMTFNKRDYNPAGVYNFCPKERQYLFVTPKFNATQNVDVLAYMFNIEKGELPQRKITIDNFWEHDYDMLGELFIGGVPHVFTDDEITSLKNIPAMLVADDLLFFYNLFERWEAPWNSEFLYWNYMHHWQGTMSYSPFACGVALYTGTPGNVTEIFNPYGTTELTVGRDNMMQVLESHTVGAFAERTYIAADVTGDALTPDESHPGWYHVSNKKNDTATITYTYTPDSGDALTLTINVTVV